MTQKQRFPLISDYGYRMGSNQSFIDDQIAKAAKLDAPRDTWAFDHDTGQPKLARDLPEHANLHMAWSKRDDWNELTGNTKAGDMRRVIDDAIRSFEAEGNHAIAEQTRKATADADDETLVRMYDLLGRTSDRNEAIRLIQNEEA